MLGYRGFEGQVPSVGRRLVFDEQYLPRVFVYIVGTELNAGDNTMNKAQSLLSRSSNWRGTETVTM